ncbi:hypothetical protein QCN29_10890 [Streptomyces sp. HNM0663]|uniref:AB hydrolase-1 domain-containing protein n=1 Tax=Streptomyces chengmaiensis TaxID=3040919 RepID=A0ABT6HKQ5_9ACTN|nr:hypothetical protein [Streptomyces chengmaiensis]MDH2389288.1 hypothetical protein [Streptomyces chengmaiensis]
MTTILYVHGTGVRAERYAADLERLTKGLADELPGVAVEPCPWGDVLGVRRPASDGMPPETAAGASDEADRRRAVWARLYDDPLYETRLAVLDAGVDASAVPPRVVKRLESGLRGLPEHGTVRERVGDEGAAALRRAVEELLADEEFDAALPALAVTKVNDLVGRAVTAQYIAVREGAAGPLVTPAERDDLAQEVADALGGTALGAGRKALRTGWRTAQRIAHPAVRRYRHQILERSTPAAGDILLYQARGKPVRTYLAERVAEAAADGGPVVLLGHSLGGIASFETLVAAALPQVRLLVSVGSQIPYLYGMDALASHRYGAPLPGHFTADWLNVHDPVDLLGFPAEPQFPGRVRDVAVDTREPFPRAHGAYWATREVYQAIAAAIERSAR